MRRLVATTIVVLLLASPLAAQVRYKDDEGVMHWVNSIDEVPEKYCPGAVGKTAPKGTPSGIDYEQKLRESDRQREQRIRDLETRAEQERAAQNRREAAEESAKSRAPDMPSTPSRTSSRGPLRSLR